jgi:hypothetical protein
MNSNSFPAGPGQKEPVASLDVVVVYEDFATGIWAKQVFDELVRKTSSYCALNNTMWKFDFLRPPKLREVAAHEALKADIVVIAGHRESDFPSPLKDWVDLWVGQKQGGLLVGLLDGDGSSTGKESRNARYLRRVAKHGGMNLLCLESDTSRSRPDPFLEEITPEDEKELSNWKILQRN